MVANSLDSPALWLLFVGPVSRLRRAKNGSGYFARCYGGYGDPRYETFSRGSCQCIRFASKYVQWCWSTGVLEYWNIEYWNMRESENMINFNVQ